MTVLSKFAYEASLKSIKKLCRVLNCKVDDIVEFVPDDQAKKVTPLVTQLSWT